MNTTSEKLEILIVDDVRDNLLALNALLERDDVIIHQALSGKEALELMLKHDFCLALLDVQMPEMNGFELAEFMRGTNNTKSIPIIFVTAADKNQTQIFKGYETGAVDFLRKPLDSHAVKSKVNVFLELHRQKLELKKQVTEQTKLVFELNKTKEKLEQEVQLREEFMSIAGHELKTPLTSLKLQTQLRKRNLDKGRYAQIDAQALALMFDADNKQIDLLTLLIDDMLDISRISSGKFSINLEPFDLCALIKEIFDRNHELFKQAGIEADLTLSGSIMGSWDKFRIEQVITNLFTNAIRYGAGKPVSIKMSTENERAIIVIKDHGIGIAKEDLKRIFQRYERVSGSKASGLGLGLYIVAQIIEAHGGTINVLSDPGKGSEFKIELPLVKALNEDEILKVSFPGKTILAVDDTSENLALLKIFLGTTETLITYAVNGQEALDLCKDNLYDIILMDIQMPKMDGLEATAAIRQLGNTNPIIALTSFTSNQEHEKCIKAGFNNVMVKPVNKKTLLIELSHYLV